MAREMQNKEAQPQQQQDIAKAVMKQRTADTDMDETSTMQKADQQIVSQQQVTHLIHRLEHISLGRTKLSNHEITLWKRTSRMRSLSSYTRADRIIQTKADGLATAILELEGRSIFSEPSQSELDESGLTEPVVEGKDGLVGDGIEKAKKTIKRLQRAIRTLRMEKAQALNLLKRARREKESAYNKFAQVLETLKERDRALVKVQKDLKNSEDTRRQVEARYGVCKLRT